MKNLFTILSGAGRSGQDSNLRFRVCIALALTNLATGSVDINIATSKSQQNLFNIAL